MCYRIDLESTLATAEAILEQLRGSTKLPESVRGALGIAAPPATAAAPSPTSGGTDCASRPSCDRDLTTSPSSVRMGERTCSTSSVEVLSDADVEARYDRHLPFAL